MTDWPAEFLPASTLPAGLAVERTSAVPRVRDECTRVVPWAACRPAVGCSSAAPPSELVVAGRTDAIVPEPAVERKKVATVPLPVAGRKRPEAVPRPAAGRKSATVHERVAGRN